MRIKTYVDFLKETNKIYVFVIIYINSQLALKNNINTITEPIL